MRVEFVRNFILIRTASKDKGRIFNHFGIGERNKDIIKKLVVSGCEGITSLHDKNYQSKKCCCYTSKMQYKIVKLVIV
jgi:hypothetical protein